MDIFNKNTIYISKEEDALVCFRLAIEASLPSSHLPTMTQVPPSPIIAMDDEKHLNVYEPKNESKNEAAADISSMPAEEVEEDVKSSDGDDALKLVGTHAHHFDEKYYARLRRKIVSHLKPIHQQATV